MKKDKKETKSVTKIVSKKEEKNNNYDNLNTLLFLILGLFCLKSVSFITQLKTLEP